MRRPILLLGAYSALCLVGQKPCTASAQVSSKSVVHRTAASSQAASPLTQETSASGEESVVIKGTRSFPTAYGRTGVQAGGGLINAEHGIRSVSTVSSDYLQKLATTSNALNALSLLPGANTFSADPFGLSPQTSLSVRGMSGGSIGFVLEGMPLNDVSDSTAYPNQFADIENYQRIALTQGSANIDSPVLNASGGLVNLSFREPAEHFGGLVERSYGSFRTRRGFARIDTGEWGESGVKAFLSYSQARSANWRGPGRDYRQHIDFKAVKEWGKENKVSLLGTWNYAMTSWYPQITKDQWAQYGQSGANNLAGTFTQGQTDYWRLMQAPFQLYYTAAPMQFTFSDDIHFKATPYFQWGYGNSPGGTNLPESGLYQGTQPLAESFHLSGAANGMATVMADYTQSTYRAGITPTLIWDVNEHHHVELGYWYDYSDNRFRQPFTQLHANGDPINIWSDNTRGTVLLADGQQLLAGNTRAVTEVNAVFIGDRMTYLDKKLVIDLGFKEVLFSRTGTDRLTAQSSKNSQALSEPLPRLGLRYQFTPEHQLFMNVTTNFRAPNESTLFNVYDPTSGALENTAAPRVRSEYSIAEEIGYRYTGAHIIGSLTFFNYNFTNRQIESTIYINGSPITTTINGGGQTSRGIDAEIGLRPWHHFSPYISAEYLYTSLGNDLLVGSDLLPTRGKRAVSSPPMQLGIGLTYDDGTFFGLAAVKYVSHQFSTFMNDEKIPAYATGNVTLGYRPPSWGVIKYPELKLNLINITNNHYLSGVASPGGNAHDTLGRNGTVIAGSAPTYYVGGGFAAMITAATAF